MDFLNNWHRTNMCGEFTESQIGSEVFAMGWVGKFRNLGNLIFIDLKDRTGLIQIAIDDTVSEELFVKAKAIKLESVLAIRGTIRSRGTNINKTLSTGSIEILASELKILSIADTTPFVISDDVNVGEALRLKYRYLDLRRPYLQKILLMRDKITKATRDYMSNNAFVEVETPFLGKSTPEGARDYLVPSRIHTGAFYALPQSPQLYKQLLMISGIDRYYQIARCFRDEDLRANRQPEFSQIDMEMSFVENAEDVMNMAEGLIKHIFKETLGIEFAEKFRKMSYKEAYNKYGLDKPYTHFGLEIVDLADIFANTEFVMLQGMTENGNAIKGINCKGLANEMTRKEIDGLTEYARGCGAKGLAYAIFKEDGTISSSFINKVSEEEKIALINKLGIQKGDVAIIMADKRKIALDTMGNLRVMIAEKHNLINNNMYDILWITEFPLFEYSEEEGRYVAMHHPFTSPMNEDIELLTKGDLANARAKAYDLVINGQEAGGGSIRIYRDDVQQNMFELLGLSNEDIDNKFGYFVEAFKYGTPPHGGLAFGLDRLVMLITKTNSIKDVIAFPKVQNASCLMSQAPNVVDDKQLKELHLLIKE